MWALRSEWLRSSWWAFRDDCQCYRSGAIISLYQLISERLLNLLFVLTNKSQDLFNARCQYEEVGEFQIIQNVMGRQAVPYSFESSTGIAPQAKLRVWPEDSWAPSSASLCTGPPTAVSCGSSCSRGAAAPVHDSVRAAHRRGAWLHGASLLEDTLQTQQLLKEDATRLAAEAAAVAADSKVAVAQTAAAAAPTLCHSHWSPDAKGASRSGGWPGDRKRARNSSESGGRRRAGGLPARTQRLRGAASNDSDASGVRAVARTASVQRGNQYCATMARSAAASSRWTPQGVHREREAVLRTRPVRAAQSEHPNYVERNCRATLHRTARL